MALPHFTKPSAHGRIADPIKAGGVLALYKCSINYPGIEKKTGVKHHTAINIVHQAEASFGAGEKTGLKKLLEKENVEPKPKKS